MHFADLIAASRRDGDVLHYPSSDDWKQGRTLYGGVSAAYCLHAARTLTDEMRALRSAMVSFVGPCVEDVQGTASYLRSGRTAGTVRAELSSGGTPCTEVLFTFSDMRDSTLNHKAPKRPDVPMPDEIDFRVPTDRLPGFAKKFESIPAGGSIPMSGADDLHLLWWARHKAPEARDGELSLLALGDILPPAAMTHMKERAPISSMTWIFNMLTDNPTTEDGWWLLEAKGFNAEGGFSSQDMTIWNTHGEMVAKGAQMVAIFT